MTILFVTNNAVAAAASGDLTITPPTTQNNDLMVCVMTSNDTVSSTFPNDWTGSILNNGSFTAAIYWKYAVGDESGNQFTITHPSGGNIISRIALYRGCDAAYSPTTNIVSNPASTLCQAQVSTDHFGCLVVFSTHIVANTTGFTNFRLFNTGGDGVCKERFLRLGDKTGSGTSTTFVDLADNIPPHIRTGRNLAATISVSTASLGCTLIAKPE